MESFWVDKIIDCHDSAKAESRNDAWDSVIANEVKQSIIKQKVNQTMESLKARFCIMDLRSVRHEILANLSQ